MSNGKLPAQLFCPADPWSAPPTSLVSHTVPLSTNDRSATIIDWVPMRTALTQLEPYKNADVFDHYIHDASCLPDNVATTSVSCVLMTRTKNRSCD